jgi:uncharacterized membrane protein YgcG
MRNILDFSSWQALLSTVIGLLVATLLMVGIRLVLMQTIQRRRERENRQINERLRTLIAAYKTLGGSFTGDLAVDPRHKRDLLRANAVESSTADAAAAGAETPSADDDDPPDDAPASVPAVPRALPETAAERRRRTRDAVEAALSDIVLLGTQEQVRLAATAAQDMVAGRSVHLAPLVHSLRAFIREALDLEPIPADVTVPDQGPLRPGASGGARNARAGGAGGNAGGGRAGGGGGGGGAGGAGMGMGLGLHAGSRRQGDDGPSA